ncbi:heparinase [Thioclava sp. SK-1]|uniref:heparinase II/III family protein n=1 Tax=Thioclava sp. SK-1 TaxID=1889770 RepID=UPI000825F757|nr:heparinase II/III family protein [Thioclava sp. SK-1]OCX66164.1 heparinase [Thioclava sp. SK-1]
MTQGVKTGQNQARISYILNRFAARRAARGQAASGFVSQPEPRTIGSFAKGRQLMAGNFLFAGFLIEAPDQSIWNLPVPDPAFDEALHGFTWLDDLAAVGDRQSRVLSQDWVGDWITRFGDGSGMGWQPDLTGRRVIRWINHALMLLNGQERSFANQFFASLGAQTQYLSRRWKSAPPGLPRFEALTGLIYASLSLTGMEALADPAIQALSRECDAQIDAQGGIPTRNPEELLEVFTLLGWARIALREAGRNISVEHLSAIDRIAPTLRTLRHADGTLARFHGGGRGAEGRLDQVLSGSQTKGAAQPGPAMGFARMQAGRCTVIVDAATPPKGAASADAHASTLAFELSSGRRQVIVSCGSGEQFGREWHRAGRATPSHSTLSIEGFSSSRLGPERGLGRSPAIWLDETPSQTWAKTEHDPFHHRIFGHDGYVPTHGMTHMRELLLSPDGRLLKGCDTLGAMTAQDRRRFETIFEREKLRGIPFDIRFHIHPDADATLDMGGHAVSIALKSGEIWVFRHDEVAQLALEPSVYLEKGRIRPRPALQIVLSSKVLDYACQINWTFAKAQDTPAAIRDLEDDSDRV